MKEISIPFIHKSSAHCETGVASNMLHHYDIPISEPMAFGLGSGLFFTHLTFIRLHGMAVTSFRPLPGRIFRRATKLLGVRLKKMKFRKPEKAMEQLDLMLGQNTPVGMLVGVYYLPYFPKEYRFHFNAHNITCIGCDASGNYLISDPVCTQIEKISRDDLKTVRYALGTYPPQGRMYWIVETPKSIDLPTAIRKAIRRNCKDMLDIPVPFIGVKGIRFLAGRLRKWPLKMGEKKAIANLGQVIRMLEEIGTGGAGFRYMYAAFLQEAADITLKPELNVCSQQMTEVGDLWRSFAVDGARLFKKRGETPVSFDELADMLLRIADREETVFRTLKTVFA